MKYDARRFKNWPEGKGLFVSTQPQDRRVRPDI